MPEQPNTAESAPCDRCGTDHDGHPAGSFGAALSCVRQQAADGGAAHLVDQADALRSDVAARSARRVSEPRILPRSNEGQP